MTDHTTTTTATGSYTDDDLRAEAARQHHELTEDPDFMGVGEQMSGTEIPSLTTEDEPGVVQGTTWDELSREDFDAARDQIHDLVTGAADVSEWAVALGADGLEPSVNAITMDGDGKPLVRVHLAFHPQMDEATRAAFTSELGRLMASEL